MAQGKAVTLEQPDLQQRVGQRIRAARAARAMSMKQLARESGVSLPYLSRVEKGDGNISLAVLSKLATALHLSADSMLADDERYGADYALIVELLKRQTPSRLREIRKALLEGPSSIACDAAAPRRIALVGMRGAGKSTLGPLLAKRLGLPFVELNKEVEKEAGVALDLIFSIYGQAGFRQLEKRCLDRVISQYPEVVLATGGGIVVEPATYELLLHSFFCVWLHAEPQEHFRRVMAQHDARIATAELHEEAMANILGALEARRKLYALAHADVDTTDREVNALVQQLDELVQGHSFGRPGSALSQALCA